MHAGARRSFQETKRRLALLFLDHHLPRLHRRRNGDKVLDTMNSSSQSLELLFNFLSRSYTTLETNFFKIPGSAVVARYVKSSHQNDPGRTLLEVILIIFAIRTLLQSRTRGDRSGKHFITFDEKVNLLQGFSVNAF